MLPPPAKREREECVHGAGAFRDLFFRYRHLQDTICDRSKRPKCLLLPVPEERETTSAGREDVVASSLCERLAGSLIVSSGVNSQCRRVVPSRTTLCDVKLWMAEHGLTQRQLGDPTAFPR